MPTPIKAKMKSANKSHMRNAKRKTGRKKILESSHNMSDSSFNISVLSASRMSTPRPWKRKRSAQKRNPNAESDRCAERATKKRKLNKTCNKSGRTTSNSSGMRGLLCKSAVTAGAAKKKKVMRPPIGKPEPKTVENLPQLFRNDAMFHSAPRPDRVLSAVPVPQSDNTSVIVIDDDEDKQEKITVEEVGKDLLDLVSGAEIPETPKTIIKKMNFNNYAKDAEENADHTIVLDDSQDRQGANSPDSVICLDEHPKSEESIQEIASKYYTTPHNMDFIPINTNPIPSNRGRRKSLIKKYKGRKRQTVQEIPPLHFNPVPDTRFAAPVDGVFRFTGTASGPTIYSDDKDVKKGLRPIVIDGSNIAFAHGRSKKFSVKGIELVVKYFKDRGHDSVVAFLPQFRSKPNMSDSRDALVRMEEEGTVSFTPSRLVDGKYISSHDDRMILDFATEKGGIVISRDNYRDMFQEHPEYRSTIEQRLLMPTFVGDTVIFPQDPLGRNGPRLDEFLKF